MNTQKRTFSTLSFILPIHLFSFHRNRHFSLDKMRRTERNPYTLLKLFSLVLPLKHNNFNSLTLSNTIYFFTTRIHIIESIGIYRSFLMPPLKLKILIKIAHKILNFRSEIISQTFIIIYSKNLNFLISSVIFKN
jgi:hypothetical protein